MLNTIKETRGADRKVLAPCVACEKSGLHIHAAVHLDDLAGDV